MYPVPVRPESPASRWVQRQVSLRGLSARSKGHFLLPYAQKDLRRLGRILIGGKGLRQSDGLRVRIVRSRERVSNSTKGCDELSIRQLRRGAQDFDGLSGNWLMKGIHRP